MKIQQSFYRATRLLAMSLLMLGSWVSAFAEIKTVEKIELCPGDTVTYRGMKITHEGVYRDSMYSIDGSLDSIFVVLVSEAHTYVRDTVANWIQGNTYGWHGQTIVANGIYYDYLKTVNGCDSTIVLHANFYPTYRFEETLTLCASELPYEWRGQQCMKEGTYSAHYATIHGQDSMYVLTLKVLPTKESWVKVDICYGSVYYFNDKPLKTSGEYTEKFISAQGCDSICHLVLNVLPELSHRDTIYVSEKQLPIQWRGQTISAQGTYFEHHTTKNDCDSDVILVVNIWPTYELTFDTTVCRADLPIVWQGQKLYKAAQYTQFAHTIHGTDSIIHLNLNVVDVQHGIVYAQKCEGEPFSFRGRELTTPGRYFDTLPSKLTACDSIVELVLTNYPTYHFEEVAVLDKGATINWHGQTITQPGVYHFNTVTVQHGCDSSYVLTVTDRPVFHRTQDTTVCERDLPLVWYGQQLYSEGGYMHYGHSAQGTDTVIQLNLKVLKTKYSKIYAKKCEDDSFFFRGRELTQPGVYYDTVPSLETGCDSIVILTLSNNPTYRFEEFMELHQDTSFMWHGQQVKGVGTYYAEDTTIQGCDSSYVLTVTRRQSYHVYDTAVICRQDAPYLWFGQQLYNTGSYTHFDYTAEGADSIHHLDLKVHDTKYATEYAQKCEKGSFFFRDRELTAAGVYYDTIPSHDGCDSIIKLVLTNYPTYRFEETAELGQNTSIQWHGQTITHPGTYYYNAVTVVGGCDSVYVLTVIQHPSYLFKQDTAVCERDLPFLWQDKQLYESGHYTSEMKSQFGTDSIYELNLTVHPTRISTKYISLCPGDPFFLRTTKVVSQAGVYYDTIPTSVGCDSIIQYIISSARSYLYETDAVLEQGQTYSWRKHVYTAAGIYEDSYKTSTGCDSIYRLILHEREPFYIDETATICRHEAPYIFHGKQYFETNTYYDTVPRKYENDTIYRLYLTVNEDYLFTEKVDLCDNDEYIFRGKVITEPGVYYDSLLSITGCDSVYMMVVNRMPSKVTETYIRIPDTEVPYEWHGQTIIESGTYIDHQSTASGCDSIYRLHLTVLPTFRFVQDTLICAGSSYEWRGRVYAQSGTYTTYYTTVEGMDSVYVLNLTVAPNYETTTMTQLCDGDSFMFYGQKIDKPGIYSETLMTKNGCDSVVNLVVNRATTSFNSEYAEICEGDFYTWRGQLYTEKGTYFDTMKTTYGCDSIFRLTLNYAPTSVLTQTISLCEGEKFFFFGQEIVDAGIYTETLISSHGCDSTIRLIVNRMPSYHFYDTLYLDNQSTHIWHGQEISASGTYTDPHTTVAGCDSVYTLTAIMQNRYHFETRATICEGEEYVWRGGTYTLSGTYNEAYHTTHGLDSIYTLYLTVNPRSEVTDYRTICKGTTIEWRNQTITEAGIYTDTLFTKHGCDSIYKLVVNIAPDFFSSETVNLPSGQQITWRGQQIQAAGTYYTEYKNQYGCDSIYELIVNVYPTYLYEDRITICDNEGGYEWHGQTFNSSGIYYDPYKTIHGMDSIYTLHLTVNHSVVHDETLMLCDGGQVTTHGKVITEPGIYYDTLLTKHGCDSVVRLIVLRAPTYLYMDDGQIPATGYYEWRNKVYTEPGVYFDSLHTIYGCDSIYQLTLHKKPVYYYEESDTVCANYLPYMYHGMSLYQTGTYYDSLLTTIGMDSVYKFQLTVLPTAADTIKETICQGDTYLFGDRVLTESGIYQQTLVAASGCDSTVTLFLNVSNIFYRTEQMTICDGATKEWHGKTIDHGGFYYDSLTSKVTKCDSIYCLQVTMVPRFYQRDTVVICDKETPYFWQGNHYDSTGVYRREYSGYAGCDSVYELNLTVLRSYFQEQRIDFCQTDGASHRDGERFFSSRIILDTMPSTHGCDSVIKFVYVAHPSYRFESVGTINPGSKYFWHGHELTQAGYYEDKDTTIYGCDSTYVLRLVENLQYEFKDTVRICDSELPYEWHGQLLSTPGSHVAPYLTVTGADSIYRLELIINPTRLTELQDSMCTGGVYYWGDDEITETGTYLRHFNTEHGCDSVVSLTINFLPTYNQVYEISISDKESYTWRGTTYSKPGTYTERISSQSGCDSVYTLVLTVLPTFYNEDTVFICQNDEPYFWHGNYYHETGIFYDSHKTQYGKDSIYCLNITVYPSFHEEKRFDICKGDVVTFLGKEYSEAGVYTEQFYTSHGCDSIYTIVVNYLPSYQFDTYAKFCRGDRYEWRGKIYTTAGIYRDVFTTVNGCDSIYVLHLTMDEPFYQLDRDTVCSNEVPYIWHNKYIFETGTYFDSLKTELGCDSVYELRLIVYPSLTNIDTVQLCHGDTAYYRDSLLTETSLFTDTTYTEYGCPIVSGVVYNFWPTYHFVDHKTVCEGTIYEWHGKTITYEGLYFDTLTTVHGCDSIYELYLEMNSTVRTDSVTVICPDSLPFTFAYAGDTTILWKDTLMEFFYRTPAGCDSIFTFNLILTDKCSEVDSMPLCPGDSVLVENKYYKEPGQYSIPYNTDLSHNYPDSIYRFALYPARTAESYDSINLCTRDLPYQYNDLYLFESGHYDDTLQTVEGCDSIVHLTLVVRPMYFQQTQINLCNDEFFAFRGEEITRPGRYLDTLITKEGCDSVVEYIVNRMPTFFREEQGFITKGGSYPWHKNGQPIMLNRAGVFYDSLRTVEGCDSVYRLILTEVKGFYNLEKRTMCESETPYEWHGYYLYESGTYFDSLMNIQGADSVYELRLTVNEPVMVTSAVKLCQGATYNFNGRIITAPGIYVDTMFTIDGCDSIVRLIVNKAPIYTERRQYFLCPGETFHLRGRDITEPGIYEDTLLTIDGCDSIIQYLVNAAENYYFSDSVEMNHNSSYMWHKNGSPFLLTHPGVFYDSLKTIHGCDSIYRLVLTEKKGFYDLEERIMCKSETPYEWHGYYLYESGTYFDSLMNIQGADSVYELRLTVNDTVLITSTVNLCGDASYDFNGRIITAPGIYDDTLMTINGCDSIVRLIVNKAPTYTVRRQYFLCPGETFHLRGMDITEPGIYEDTLLTIDGCDSIIQYLVNTAESYFFLDSVEMNHNSSYMWHKNGSPFLLTHPGVFYDSLKTIHGCDSIYRLVLTEKKGFYNLEERTICKSETPFEWHGFYLYEPGIYFDSLMNLQGVDSVYELHLIINEPTLTTSTVNLCRETSYDFNGRMITEPGIYEDTLMTIDGCDSIVRLIVNKARTYTERRQYFLCPGESFFLRDRNITEPGIYEDTLMTIDGCDSIIQYVVNEAEHYFFSDTATTDLNGTYKWHKNGAEIILTESGVYYDSCRTVHGCDSVYELVLHCGSYNNKQIYSCVGDTVRVNDLTITKDTSFMITYRASFGCDSVVRYNVTFEPTYYKEIRANVMDNETYDFDGDKVHQPGRYYHYHQSQYGCDSTVCLNLTVNETYYTREYIDFCMDSVPYTHHGKQYWSNAELHDTLRSSHGSDSIVVTYLTVHPKIPETIINMDVCETDSVTIRGRRFGGSMFQTKRSIVLLYDTLLSKVTGCDSIIKYIVNVHQTYMIDEYDTFCEGTAYIWRDKHQPGRWLNDTTWIPGRLHHDTIWTPGTYYDSLVTVEHGCDSIFRLHLEATDELYNDETVLVCYDELPYLHPYNNHLYYNDTVFFDTLITAGGCQDIHRTHYRLTNHCTYQETHICVNEYPTSFEGNRIDKSGDYRFFKMTSTGLDSVIRVKAIDLDTYENYVTLPGIYCDSVVFDGRVYYMSLTNHPIYYKSEMGCDSVVYLTVTVNNSTRQYDPLVPNPVIIPDYQAPYLWHGKEYTQTGTYEYHDLNAGGCDNTVWMRLIVVPTTYEAPLNYTVCAGETFTNPFNGTTMIVTKDIVLEDKVWNPTAQQSIIRTANVMVEYPFTITNMKIPEQLCAEQSMSFDIDFTYDGTLPTTYTVEFMDPYVNFSPRKQKGTLTSAQIPISVTANGACVTPGDYHINITLEGKSCTQSKVTIPQTLHVLYPSSVLESNWDNVVAIVNEKYNAGNWVFTAPFAWMVQDKDLVDKTYLVAPASSSQPYLHSDYLKDGDLVTAYLIRQGTSQPIATCPFVFHAQSYGKGYDVLCVPTRVPKKSPQCAIMANCTGSYAIYDLLGHAWHSGMLEGDQTLISMPPVTGYYLVVVTTPDNQLHTQKVMVY